jgi:hypothetical protein
VARPYISLTQERAQSTFELERAQSTFELERAQSAFEVGGVEPTPVGDAVDLEVLVELTIAVQSFVSYLLVDSFDNFVVDSDGNNITPFFLID